MNNFAKTISWFFAAGLVITLSLANPASAITADLAKKCRAMAIEKHPSVPAGTKTGNAKAQRDFYITCITNNGTMPDNNTQNTTAPAPK
jgi:hypothetical protein